jgi:hypothetical protein
MSPCSVVRPPSSDSRRTIMLDRYMTGAVALATAVLVTLSGAAAFD